MQSERIQQRIERLLADADAAIDASDWPRVRDRAENVLRLDPQNADALAYIAGADRGTASEPPPLTPRALAPAGGERGVRGESPVPTSFVGGRYQVERFLGEGATKRVYLVHDTQLDRDVAFALIKTEGLHPNGLTRIRREAQAMGRLGDHPNIVAVHDIGDEGGQPYIVSQFMAGGDVQTRIEQADDRRLPLDDVLRIAGQVCQALAHAHSQGVIHRDLKPGNVWLTGSPSPSPSSPRGEEVTPPPDAGEAGRSARGGRTGEGASPPIAKLGDFGLAVALDRSRLTQAGMVVGTVAYMAPEQALGREVTPRSDLYSLGAMLYELVTGRPPFLGASRRLRLHQRVACGLEAVHGRRLEEHASELAEHYAQSTDAADLEKALHYSEVAADRATQVYAYGEAVRHLERALQVQDVLDPDDKAKRCDLLLALGDAMLPLDDPGRIARTVANESFAIAELLGDSQRATRAALQAYEAGVRAQGGVFERGAEGQAWARRADLHAREGTIERVYADMYLGLSTLGESRPPAHALLRRAVERARALGDDAALFGAASFAFTNLQPLQDWNLLGALADEVLGRDRRGARSRDLQVCLASGGNVLFDRGNRGGMEREQQDLAELAERTQDATIAVSALAGPIFVAYLDGRLEEALNQFEELRTHAESTGLSRGGGSTGVGLSPLGRARALCYLGRPLEPALEDLVPPPRGNLAGRAVALGLLGRYDEALAIVAGFGDVGSPDDETGAVGLVALLEAAVLCKDTATAAALAARFAPLGGCLHAYSGLSIGRLLGDAARLLDRPQEARQYYQQALEVSERVRFRPEIALTRLDLAELLLEHYPKERAEALEHLNFASREFDAMKMAPSLQQALELRASLV